MGLTSLKFDNEEDRKIARDINLDLLEREGWTPKPDLDLWVTDERAAAVKQELDQRGVPYTEEQL